MKKNKQQEIDLMSKFLISRTNAGGLYGLTISSDDFKDGIKEVIDSFGDEEKMEQISKSIDKEREEDMKRVNKWTKPS
jgi:hypothetical protein